LCYWDSGALWCGFLVALEEADTELGHDLESIVRVACTVKGLCGILTCGFLEHIDATGMVVDVMGNVQDLAMDDDPVAVLAFVFSNLSGCEL